LVGNTKISRNKIMEDAWTNRRNYKTFLVNEPVPVELEKKLDHILQHCPVQRHGLGYVNYFKCTENDTQEKELLSRYVFRNNDTGFHETAPITAPLVYFCASPKNADIQDALAAGIVGGAMMSETIKYGYDFSFIGCTEECTDAELNIINNTLENRFGVTQKYKEPFLALCIGKGDKEVSPGDKVFVLKTGGHVKYQIDPGNDPLPKLLFT